MRGPLRPQIGRGALLRLTDGATLGVAGLAQSPAHRRCATPAMGCDPR
jgi:hypothetical protein